MMTVTPDGGSATEIGLTVYEGTSLSIKDFSRKEYDELGTLTLIQRGYQNLVTYSVEVDVDRIGIVKQALADCRAQLTTFVGHPDLPELTVQGYLNSFSIPLSSESVTTITIEVESQLQGVADP